MPSNTMLVKFKVKEIKAGDVLVTEDEDAFDCLENGKEYKVIPNHDGQGVHIMCLLGIHRVDNESFVCDEEGYAKYIKKKEIYVSEAD